MTDSLIDHPIPLKEPCPDCGAVDGLVNTAGAHQKLTCGDCGRYIRFVGKAELGLVPRTVATTRAGITPGVRARILERATGKCEVCGATDRPIHVGHCLSVREATEQGLTDEEINHEENLMAMCEDCNLGWGKRPVPVRLLARVIMARLRRGNP